MTRGRHISRSGPAERSLATTSRLSETEQASSESVAALITALVAVRSEFARTERSLRHHLAGLEGGCTTVDEFVSDVRPDLEARQLTDSLEEVDEARRAARLGVFSLALERGYSIVEMAQAWGVPRQLASRYVHQAMSRSGQTEGA